MVSPNGGGVPDGRDGRPVLPGKPSPVPDGSRSQRGGVSRVDGEDPERLPLLRLLDEGLGSVTEQLEHRIVAAGYADLRPSHRRVLATIGEEGSRLTDLARRARMTKQSLGELTNELEIRGYVGRTPDPVDGRAKTIKLSERGNEFRAVWRRLSDDLERDWAGRVGAWRMANLRETLAMIINDRGQGR